MAFIYGQIILVGRNFAGNDLFVFGVLYFDGIIVKGIFL